MRYNAIFKTVKKAMMNGIYILATGQKAAQTLEKQHEIMSVHSIEQLQKAGLKEGMIVWDVGCGTGTMTEYIAKTEKSELVENFHRFNSLKHSTALPKAFTE
jgi:cyclopropane fatty-acyl-phospholipid synthase-like methyltransferase